MAYCVYDVHRVTLTLQAGVMSVTEWNLIIKLIRFIVISMVCNRREAANNAQLFSLYETTQFKRHLLTSFKIPADEMDGKPQFIRSAIRSPHSFAFPRERKF